MKLQMDPFEKAQCMTVNSLGLMPQDISALLAILKQYIPRGEVWAFGSRVKGQARPFSDLDLAVIQNEPLDAQTKAELHYVLSESSLPIKVDNGAHDAVFSRHRS
jgi:predicted nucleotidyltransferase